MADLAQKTCVPCRGGMAALEAAQARALAAELPDWTVDEAAASLTREFRFRNFHETMAFVNAVAFLAHQQDHHPDLEVSWGRCVVRYTTHAAKGLTENDFICAAKVDRLVAGA